MSDFVVETDTLFLYYDYICMTIFIVCHAERSEASLY